MVEDMLLTEDIMNLITRELNVTMGADADYYSGYKLMISNEQQFVSEDDRDAGIIYIVVKFLQGNLNFGQTTMPVTITAVSEQNGIEVCQKLLYEFSNTYNLTSDVNDEIQQTYTSPVVSGNFSDVFSGFRSLFMMTGTFLYSKHANPATITYGGVAVPMINLTWKYSIALNSITTAESNHLTTSKAEYATWAINITTYLLDSGLVDDCMEAICTNTLNDKEYELIVTFKNGRSLTNTTFKLKDMTGEQPIGNQPVVSLSFTN